MKNVIPILTLFLVLALFLPASAQSATSAPTSALAPVPVTVQATDGLTLSGAYWQPAAEAPIPAVLVPSFPQLDWQPMIAALVDAGYGVLVVDLSGRGVAGGALDAEAATTDMQSWLDWMREQPDIRPDAISMIGSSVGANLALVACAADDRCATAIALSPVTVSQSAEAKKAVTSSRLSDLGALLVASQGDSTSSGPVRQWTRDAFGQIAVRLYAGAWHGVDMFRHNGDSLVNLIVYWLGDRTPPLA